MKIRGTKDILASKALKLQQLPVYVFSAAILSHREKLMLGKSGFFSQIPTRLKASKACKRLKWVMIRNQKGEYSANKYTLDISLESKIVSYTTSSQYPIVK
ncbi:hypothetical protein ACJJIG_09875 [Microbulbifer sp. SSSA007]|uniref:hypothetical protein n=1 Tax=Microbulbifer sp. SSSA007 TaxID=3243379 RepID=UPI004039CA78